jgi:cardiolipin synthase
MNWPVQQLLSILSFVLTLIFISFLVRSRRAPGSTMAWLLIVLVMPYIGIPFFLMFGQRKIKAPFLKKKPLYSHLSLENIPKGLTSLEKVIRAAGCPVVSHGNSINLLESGEDAFECVLKLIESAESELLISTFILGNDDVGKKIMEAAANKARIGTQVRVLVDSIGSAWFTHPSFKILNEAGAKVAFFMPVFHIPFRGRTNLRNHRKIIIVDRREAIIGGMNLAQEYMGPTPDEKRWVDLSLSVQGPAVKDLIDIFESDWSFTTKESQEGYNKTSEARGSAALNHAPNALNSHDSHGPSISQSTCVSHSPSVSQSTSDSRKALVQVIASGPDVPRDNLYDALITLIFGAKELVWIVTPYFLPDESLTKALELAARRNLDVRLLVPKKSNHKLADICRGSFVKQIEEAGAKVFYFDKMIHAKLVIVDDLCAVVGSANFDMRSLLLNYELGVLLYNETEISKLKKWFQKLTNEANMIKPRVGFLNELAEGVGRVLSPLL